MKNVLTNIAFAKELHPHDGEDEDNDAQHESEVAQGPNCLAHNRNEQVERRPRLGQFENTELKFEKKVLK